MKYTPSQRIEYYNRAIIRLKDRVLSEGQLGYITGICNQLRIITGASFAINISDFPELLRRKPSDKESWEWWWPLTKKGFDERISVLEECIEEARGLFV